MVIRERVREWRIRKAERQLVRAALRLERLEGSRLDITIQSGGRLYTLCVGTFLGEDLK